MQDKKNITVIRELAYHKPSRPCVVAIGNFDGLHRGHREIIRQVTTLAEIGKATPTVITFEPMPIMYLKPKIPVYRLMSLTEKIKKLRDWGIEQIICLRFNQVLATLSPQEFIDSILVKALNVQHVIVGENFRFGYQQQGDLALLKIAAQKYGFEIHPQSLLYIDNERISSTALRQALLAGDCERAKHLLGYPYSVTRRVVRGAKRGKEWGFPTANIVLPRTQQWLNGVYATHVYVGQNQYKAVTNVGTRPTVEGIAHVVESHLLHFEGDLYTKRITVEFLHKIRDEKKFENINALRAQIEQDREQAKKILVERL